MRWFIRGDRRPASCRRRACWKGIQGQGHQTHGVATNDFIRLGGKGGQEGTLMAGGPILVPTIWRRAIRSPVAQGYIKAYEAKYGPGTTSTFGANTWDAGLLLQKAIPEASEEGEGGDAGVPH